MAKVASIAKSIPGAANLLPPKSAHASPEVCLLVWCHEHDESPDECHLCASSTSTLSTNSLACRTSSGVSSTLTVHNMPSWHIETQTYDAISHTKRLAVLVHVKLRQRITHRKVCEHFRTIRCRPQWNGARAPLDHKDVANVLVHVVWALHHHKNHQGALSIVWSAQSTHFAWLRIDVVNCEASIRQMILHNALIFSGSSCSLHGLKSTSRRPRSTNPKPNVMAIYCWSSSSKPSKAWSMNACACSWRSFANKTSACNSSSLSSSSAKPTSFKG